MSNLIFDQKVGRVGSFFCSANNSDVALVRFIVMSVYLFKIKRKEAEIYNMKWGF